MPVWAYAVAVPVFGLLILVHELGHYVVGKRNGIGVAEFAIGWGPRLFGRTFGGTLWTLRALPLGGYVRWADEGQGSFFTVSARARARALFAGPLANLLLTTLLLAVLYGPVQGGGARALWQAFRTTVGMIGWWFAMLADLLQGEGAALSGPVGIAQVTAEQAVAGLEHFLFYVAVLSLNLGLFNLIPFPGFDGGRLIFVLVERLRRRRMDPYVEGWIHAGGFLGLLLLICYTTVRDILA